MRYRRNIKVTGSALLAIAASLMVAGCGGGGSVSSTPPPPPSAPTPPPPPPPPTVNFQSEASNSNAPVQAQASAAYAASATGKGIIAAVIDSGVDLQSDEFLARIHPDSRDIVGTRTIDDEGGHGTSVASVLLGARNGIGTHGIAYDAQLLALRTDVPGSCTANPDEGCSHNDNDLARAVDQARITGARVINMSLGGSPPNSNLVAAIDRATAQGIIIVISAGNERDTDPVIGENPDSFAQIANKPQARGLVIIAGAVDSAGVLTDFSNKAGTFANFYLTALGRRVRSIDETGATFLFSGTSYSAPIISGAVALVAQAFPTLTSSQIVDLLFRTATDRGDPGDDSTYGQGELNLAAAFRPQGQTSLAGTAIPVSLSNNGALSGSMGDAGKTGAQTIILDEYRRAFDVTLGGSIASAPIDPKLGPALNVRTHSLLAQGGGTGIALSIAGDQPVQGAEQLFLNAPDREAARALAGSLITNLSKSMRFAIGAGRSGLALVDDLILRRGAAFVAADRAADSWGFFKKTNSATALAHTVAGFDLSVAAETGQVRLWEQASQIGFRPGYESYRFNMWSLGAERAFGPLKLGARIAQLNEPETVLGARFSSLIGNGAQSWLADAELSWQVSGKWNLAANWRQGWTKMAAGGLRGGASRIKTDAWSFEANLWQILSPRDQLSIRIAQPLRVASGGFSLNLPQSYDYFTGVTRFGPSAISLSPSGREVDFELGYSVPFEGGSLGFNTYMRQQPGHIATAPNDLGAAIRLSKEF